MLKQIPWHRAGLRVLSCADVGLKLQSQEGQSSTLDLAYHQLTNSSPSDEKEELQKICLLSGLRECRHLLYFESVSFREEKNHIWNEGNTTFRFHFFFPWKSKEREIWWDQKCWKHRCKIKLIDPEVLLWWKWVRQINAKCKWTKQPNNYKSHLLPHVKV